MDYNGLLTGTYPTPKNEIYSDGSYVSTKRTCIFAPEKKTDTLSLRYTTTLPKTNSLPLKISHPKKKWKDRLPTIIFQV